MLFSSSPSISFHDIFQAINWSLQIIWNRSPAELLEIKQAGVFPNLCIDALSTQLALNMGKAFFIYIRLNPIPGLLKLANLI